MHLSTDDFLMHIIFLRFETLGMINICTHIIYQLYNMQYVNNVNCYVYNGAYTCMQGRAYPKLCGHPLIVFIFHLYNQLAVYV